MKKLILMIVLSFVFTAGYAHKEKKAKVLIKSINTTEIKALKQTYISIRLSQVGLKHPGVTVSVDYGAFYSAGIGEYVNGKYHFRKFNSRIAVLNYFADAGYFLVNIYFHEGVFHYTFYVLRKKH